MYQMNPVNEYYMRNAQQQMNPLYNQGYQLQLPFPPPQQPQIHASWVTSVDEARAAQMDFVATNIYLDTSCGKIYLKSIGDNGKPQFVTYSIENESEKDPLTDINTRLTNIEKFIGGLKNEPISGNASLHQSEPVAQQTAAGSYESDGTAESAGFPKNARNDSWKKRN